MLLLRPVSNSSPYMSVFPRGFPQQAARSCGTKLRSQSFQRKSACFHVYTLLYNLRQYWFAKKSLLLQDPKTQCFLPKNCETQPPVSIGWVALSSVVRLVGHSSRIGDISSHLHYMMFPSIQTIYFLWGYDTGNMSVPIYLLLLSWAQFTVV